VRDYVYVKDVAGAYLTLAERMDDAELHGLAYNIGTGEPVSVLDLTHRLLAACDRPDLEPIVQNAAHGEILRQYLSTGRAAQKLGWQPSASLNDRLRETVAWYRTHLDKL
jgi:nucleoside-diphosphate-sugar epimerase